MIVIVVFSVDIYRYQKVSISIYSMYSFVCPPSPQGLKTKAKQNCTSRGQSCGSGPHSKKASSPGETTATSAGSRLRVPDPSKLEEEKKDKGRRRDSLFRFSRFLTEPVSFWNLEPGTRFYLVNHRSDNYSKSRHGSFSSDSSAATKKLTHKELTNQSQ